MAKASKALKTATQKDDRPAFRPDTVVVGPCMVVDRNGVAWWVNPGARTIKRVL
jgi:hypothetical protein